MRTKCLTLEDNGSVYLRGGIDRDDEYLGKIDDPDCCPDGLEREWRHLAEEMEDQRQFADGCLWTAQNAFSMAQGDLRRWN